MQNQAIFSLDVLLIKLCFGLSQEQSRVPEELGRNNTPNAVNDFMTATRLIDNVYNEAGIRYGVRRCSRCEFDGAIISLLEEDFSDFHQLRNS